MRFVATSASRDAENREEFVAGVRGRLGVEPEVITGDEEAALSFTGAHPRSRIAGAADPVPRRRHRRWLDGVRAWGSRARAADGVRIVDVGCVRMTERHFRDDPPLAGRGRRGARRHRCRDRRGARRAVPLRRAGTLVGLAGSVTTVAALALGLPEYDAAAIHGARDHRR